MKAMPALLAAMTLCACDTDGVSPDAAELANIGNRNVVPKSTPAAFVSAFNQFCVTGERDVQSREMRLRRAGYVSAISRPDNGIELFLVDDRRPAVVLSDTMCLVQAVSRTGQTERARRYIADTFPDARRLDTDQFEKEVEDAWRVASDAIVTTLRTKEPTPTSRYALVYFTPASATN